MSSSRAFLLAPLSHLLIAEPTAETRAVFEPEIPELAQLYIDAYRNSVDDEGLSVADARARLSGLAAGGAGEPLRDAWLAAYDGCETPVAAILCTEWRGTPFIAELMTTPTYRNRGLATSLIRQAASVVESAGGSMLGIMVSRENPALSLYGELGFSELVTPTGVQ